MISKIILVDTTTWFGHHEAYFLIYTKLLLELGFKVKALCLGSKQLKASFPQAISDGNLAITSTKLLFHQKLVFKLAKILSYLPIIPLSSSQINSLSRWQQLKNIEEKNSYVFILDLQGYLCPINYYLQKILLPQRWAGLYVCPPKVNKLLEMGKGTIKHSSCKALCLLNEEFADEIKAQFSNPQVIHLPDIANTNCPLETPKEILELQAKANGRKIVLLSGLSKRQGLLNFLKLAETMKTEPILFCAIGLVNLKGYSNKEQEYIEFQLSSGAENLFLLTNYYPEEKILNYFFKVADVAYLCQEGFIHSSNKFTKAIHLKTPALVSDNTLLANRVKKYHLGYVVNPSNLEEMKIATKRLIFDFNFDIALRQSFVNYYSKLNLKNKLADLLI
jgi:glycosyltransferase involved in cell wall biosynthesis